MFREAARYVLLGRTVCSVRTHGILCEDARYVLWGRTVCSVRSHDMFKFKCTASLVCSSTYVLFTHLRCVDCTFYDYSWELSRCSTESLLGKAATYATDSVSFK
jgi:hypothetical protein